jgi:hypothetical protein
MCVFGAVNKHHLTFDFDQAALVMTSPAFVPLFIAHTGRMVQRQQHTKAF